MDNLTSDAFLCVGLANGLFSKNVKDVPDEAFDHIGFFLFRIFFFGKIIFRYTVDGETIAEGKVILDRGIALQTGSVVTMVTDAESGTVAW